MKKAYYNPRRCLKGNHCEAKEKTGRHMVSVQNGDHYKNGVKTNQPGVYNLNDRYAIPEAVIYDILSPALSWKLQNYKVTGGKPPPQIKLN